MYSKELESWFKGRHLWLQDAARRLVINGRVTEVDILELFTICYAEANDKSSKIQFGSLPDGALAKNEPSTPFRLRALSDVKGVNALRPSKPLEFGECSLTIVFGHNGSGKSGYSRLLKNACGTRQKGEILSDVFEEHPENKSAVIEIDCNGAISKLLWAGAPIPELQEMDIYDSESAMAYINEENEVVFEPWVLRLLADLVSVCKELGAFIQHEIDKLYSNKPIMPLGFTGTEAEIWYGGISANTPDDEIEKKVTWTEEQEGVVQDIVRRLADRNPAELANLLRRQRDSIYDLRALLQKRYDHLSDDGYRQYRMTKTKAELARKASEDQSAQIFAAAPFQGIGTESWLNMWEAARRYSVEIAYPGLEFPNIENGARCVLCQNELKDEGTGRFKLFVEYLSHELHRLAGEALNKLKEFEDTNIGEVSDQAFLDRIAACGIREEKLNENVRLFAELLSKRAASFKIANSIEQLIPLPDLNLLDELDQLATQRMTDSLKCDQDAAVENRAELLEQQNQLSALKWISQQAASVKSERNRLRVIAELENAQRLTNPIILTKRKSELADEIITKDFVQRFESELKLLSVHPPSVTLKKSKAELGKVYHKTELADAKKHVEVSRVLSEGEQRIVSIAAFLADCEGRSSRSPFVFDDPISSLDHLCEEAVASRIAELSKSRQVIVFTHRLSLLSTLQFAASKTKADCHIVSLSNHRIGEVTELPISLKKTNSAINTILNSGVPALRKAYGNDDAYLTLIKALCSEIRIILERVVEKDLLRDIVCRFRREIHMQRVNELGVISSADCKHIDDLMTKYSRYEHSQPADAPVLPPKPDEIEADLKNLLELVNDLKKRAEAA